MSGLAFAAREAGGGARRQRAFGEGALPAATVQKRHREDKEYAQAVPFGQVCAADTRERRGRGEGAGKPPLLTNLPPERTKRGPLMPPRCGAWPARPQAHTSHQTHQFFV